MEALMKILKFIRNIIFIVIIVGIITAFIDYTRMISGSEPVFNISSYNSIKHIESYRGLFYQATRKTKINDKESLMDSSEIKFFVLTKQIDVPEQFKDKSLEYTIKPISSETCEGTSKLYYADTNIKIYSYCFDSFKIVESGSNKEESIEKYLKEDKYFYEDLIQKMAFTGLYLDGTTELYKSVDGFSSEDISMYRCNAPGINDLYIVPRGVSFMNDFCTYKDDDFKFISTIEEEKVDAESADEKENEVFYEDDQYYYEFDEAKKDRIFVSSPAVRLTPERRYSLADVLNNKILTIHELEEKGLKFTKRAKGES